MKRRDIVRLFVCMLVAAAIIGAYVKGRNDALIAEFKQHEGTMVTLTHWETNHPSQLKEFVKAHYYHLANQIPKSWVERPYDICLLL